MHKTIAIQIVVTGVVVGKQQYIRLTKYVGWFKIQMTKHQTMNLGAATRINAQTNSNEHSSLRWIYGEIAIGLQDLVSQALFLSIEIE
ncbi:hypothetical protein D9M71_610970 [compost metagenome]